jgi:hypothetical protein
MSVSSFVYAQKDTSSVIKITLIDGSEFIGQIMEETDSLISFRTNAGVSINLNRTLIVETKVIQGTLIGTEFLRNDPNQTRLFFSPTGKTLAEGKGYFSDYMIFFPFVAYGVTDYITLAGGMTLIPGATSQLFYIAPKVRLINRDNLTISTGVLYTQFEEYNVGVTYGVFTYENQKFAVTGGLGWGFAKGEFSASPLALIGFELRVSKYVKIISENWIPPETDLIVLMLGIRFFGENLAADIAMVRATSSEWTGFPFIPWVGFAYNF